MKKASIILFIVLLSLTVCSENVKADNNLSAQKEQEINLFEGVFRFAEEILGTQPAGSGAKAKKKKKGARDQEAKQEGVKLKKRRKAVESFDEEEEY